MSQIFYDPRVTPRTKKYSVYTPKGRLIHFGARGMQHYRDRTGVSRWSALDHNDRKRRAAYLARAKGIRDGSGRLTWNNPESANYYSVHYLW